MYFKKKPDKLKAKPSHAVILGLLLRTGRTKELGYLPLNHYYRPQREGIMKRWICVLVLFSGLLSSAQINQPASELERVKASYQKNFTFLGAEYSNKVAQLNQRYVAALDDLMKRMTQAGNLDSALAIRNEKKLFEQMPTTPPQNAPVNPIVSVEPASDETEQQVAPVIDFLSAENLAKFSFEPQGAWSTTNNTLVFTEKEPQIKGYATFDEVLSKKQAFSMTAVVDARNIGELGFGFGGGFQMSTPSPADGKSYELFLVVSGNRSAYWVEKKRQGSYYSWGGILKLGVCGKDNTKSKKAVYSKLEFRELTTDKAEKLLRKK